MTTDGTKEAFIHFGYKDDTYGLTAAAQDEWLVSPEVTLASNETLHFLLQADYMNVYNCNDFDWSTATWPNEREVVNTLKIMVTEDDGKNWTEVWDLAKNVTDKLTDRECYDASDLKIRPQAVDLSAYAGKTVKVAFRYWRVGIDWTGNSMIVDGVTISHPSPAGIDNVKANGSQNAAAEYFTVNGMRVSNVKPATKGLYIERKNGVARKVVVK